MIFHQEYYVCHHFEISLLGYVPINPAIIQQPICFGSAKWCKAIPMNRFCRENVQRYLLETYVNFNERGVNQNINIRFYDLKGRRYVKK